MIINGDSLKELKQFPDNYFSSVVTDPPYGTTQNKWDTIVDLKKMWAELYRVVAPNAPIVMFSQMPFTSTLVESNKKDFKLEWIWEKPNGTGHLNAKKYPLKNHENILVFCKKTPHYNPQFSVGSPYSCVSGEASKNYGKQHSVKTINDGKRYPKTVLKFNKETGFHPTQKPVSLLEYLIKTHTPDGGIVLDPFCGSGSTGVAAKRLGFGFVGIEMSKEYAEIAKRRIA